MTQNFFIYTDKGGKMPQLRYKPWQCITHPYFVQYVNNRPVKYHGPDDLMGNKNGSVWCYASSDYVPLSSIQSV